MKQQIFHFFVLGLVLQVFSGDESPALTLNGKGDLGSGGEILNVGIMRRDNNEPSIGWRAAVAMALVPFLTGRNIEQSP